MLSTIHLLCIGSRPATSGQYVGACFLSTYCALALGLLPRVYTWVRAFYLLIVHWLSACYLGSISGCVLSIYLLCVGSRPATSGQYVGACFLSTYCALALGLLPRVYTWVRAFYLLIVRWLSACYLGSIRGCVLSIYLLCVGHRPATSGQYVSACFLSTYCALALGLLPRVNTWVRALYPLIVHWLSACYLGSIRECVLSIYLLCVGSRPATSGLYVSACFLSTYCALALGLLPRVNTWVRAFYLLIVHWLSACYLGSIRGCVLSIYLLCIGSRPATSGQYVGACFLSTYCALALGLLPRVNTWVRALYLLIVRWLSACYLGSIRGCVLSTYLLCIGSRPATSGLYVSACFLSTYCALALGLLPRVNTWVRAFYLLIVRWLSACYLGSIRECMLSIYLLCVGSRPATSGLYVGACFLPIYCALALALPPRVYTWGRAFYLLIVRWLSACYLGSIRGCVLSIYLLCVGSRPAISGLYVGACFLSTYCALALGLLPRVYTWVRAFYLLIVHWLSACYLGSILECVLSIYLLCVGSRPPTSGQYVGACFLSTYCALALGLIPRVYTWVRAFYLLIVHWLGSRPALLISRPAQYVSACFLSTYCALALGLPRVNTWVRAFYLLIVRWLSACCLILSTLLCVSGSRPATWVRASGRVYTWVRAFYLLIVRWLSACYLGSIRGCVLSIYLLCVGSRPATSGQYVGAWFLSTYCALSLGLLQYVVLYVSAGQYVGASFLSTYCAFYLGSYMSACFLFVHWLSACYLGSIRGCVLSIYLLCIGCVPRVNTECVLSTYLLCVGSRPPTSGLYVSACFLSTYCALALGLLPRVYTWVRALSLSIPRVYTWVRAFYLLIVLSACYLGSIRGCVLSIYLLCLLPWLSACYLGSIRGCVLSTYLLCVGSRCIRECVLSIYLLCVGSRPATSGLYVSACFLSTLLCIGSRPATSGRVNIRGLSACYLACFLSTYCALALGLLPRVYTWVRAFYLLIVGSRPATSGYTLALGLLPRVYTWVRAFYLLIVHWLSACYLGSILECVLSIYLLCVGSRPATSGLYVGACFLSTYCALALGLLPTACYGSIHECVLSTYLLCVGSRPASSGQYVGACFLSTYCALALGLLPRVNTWVRAFYLLIVHWCVLSIYLLCVGSACYLGSIRGCVLSTYLLCIGSRPGTSGLYVSAFLPTYCALALGLLPRVYTWVRECVLSTWVLLIVHWLSACYLGSFYTCALALGLLLRGCVLSIVHWLSACYLYLLCFLSCALALSRPATSGLYVVSACYLPTYCALALGLLPRVYTWVRAFYLLIVRWLSACFLGSECVLSIYLLCIGSRPATSGQYVGASFLSTYCALALGLLPRVNTWVRAFYLLIVHWLSACYLGSIRECVLSIYLLCVGSRPATSGQYVGACFLSTYCALALGLLPRVNTWVRAFYLLIVHWLSACYLGSIRGCVLSTYLLCVGSRPATSGQYVSACFLPTYCALALGLLPRVYTWVRAFYLLIVRWLSACYLGSIRECVLSIYLLCVGSRPATSGLYVSACFLSTYCALALGLLPRVYTWVRAFYLLIVRWLSACYLGSIRECVLSIYLLCVGSRPATSGHTWVRAFYLLIVHWLSACYLGSIRGCVLSTYLLCIGSRPATSGLYVIRALVACFLSTYCALALGLLPRVNTWVRAFYLLIVRWLSACYLGSIRECVLSIYLLCIGSRPATSGQYVGACFLSTYCALALGLLPRVNTWVRAFYLLIVHWLSACYLGSIRGCVLSIYLLCVGSRPATSGLYVSACFLPTYCALALGLLPRVYTWVRAFYLLIVRWLSACYLGSIRGCVLSIYLLCVGSRPATSGLYVGACFLSTYCALALGLLPRVNTWVRAFYLLIVHWLSACYLG